MPLPRTVGFSREAGMDAHLSKPVSSRELVEALAHIAADAS